MNVRKLFLSAHLVVGLLSAVMLLVSSSTGGVLAFEKELHVALNRKLMRVPPQGERLALGALVGKLERTRPEEYVTALAPSPAGDGATLVTLRHRQSDKRSSYFVDPFTAEILGPQDSRNTFMEQLRQFHRTLWLGDAGRLVTALGAGSLIVLSLTGVALWWRQKLFKLNGSSSGRRRNFEIHNVLGIYASVSMLIFALTGLGVYWERDAGRWVNRWLGRTEAVADKPVPPAPNAVPLSVEQVETIALRAAPGAKVMFIDGIGGLRSPIKVRLRYTEDRSPTRQTALVLDPTTGNVLLSEGPTFKLWNQQLHTGEILGWPTRILSLLAALSLPILALTGPLIWWGRTRRRNAAAPVESP